MIENSSQRVGNDSVNTMLKQAFNIGDIGTRWTGDIISQRRRRN